MQVKSSPTQFKNQPVERYFFKSKSTSYHQNRRQMYLMTCFSFTLDLAYRTKKKESNRSALGKIEQRDRPSPLPRACLLYKCLHNHITQQEESELNPRAREATIKSSPPRNSLFPFSKLSSSSRSKLWKANRHEKIHYRDQ